LVWESYFLKDLAKFKELIGEDFITINPGEERWQNHAEFVAGARAFADHQGKLVSLSFHARRSRISAMWRSCIRWYRLRWRAKENENL
jgi:hypothetical protein